MFTYIGYGAKTKSFGSGNFNRFVNACIFVFSAHWPQIYFKHARGVALASLLRHSAPAGKHSKRPQRAGRGAGREAGDEPEAPGAHARLVDAGCFLGDLMAKANKVSKSRGWWFGCCKAAWFQFEC
jgi:hypothetical protein